jgi:hypothetical protein
VKPLGRNLGGPIVGADERRVGQFAGGESGAGLTGLESREQQPRLLPDRQEQGAKLGITDHQPH